MTEALAPKATQLLNELEAAEGILEHERRTFTFDADSGADDRAIALMNIRYDLRQAVLTLRLLADRLLRVRELELFLREAHLPNGPLTQGPILDAFLLVSALGEENEIYIKALYHTLYEIQELLEVGSLKDEVPKDLRNELDRVVTYRNKVVVHKKDQRVHLRGTRARHSENLEQTFGTLRLPGRTSPDKWGRSGLVPRPMFPRRIETKRTPTRECRSSIAASALCPETCAPK